MAAIANVKVIESMIEIPAVSVRKVNRPARVGDLVKAMYEGLDIKCGAFYEVIDVNNRSFFFIDDVGDMRERKLDASQFEVYEKVTESAKSESEPDDLFTYEGVQYRKVKRKAAVGERVLIVAIASESRKVGNVSVGEVFTVKTVDGSGDVWAADEREFPGIISGDWDGVREYVVLEPVKSAEPPKPATPPARIPVGSYVKITNGDDLPNGSIAKVVADDHDWCPYKCELLDSSDYDYLTEDDFEVLSEAEAKAEAERKKWAAIGREVGEYKRGDIVHYVCKNGSIGIGTVEDVGELALGVRNDIKTHSDTKYKGVFFREGDTATLIVPVEQRFDRTEAVS